MYVDCAKLDRAYTRPPKLPHSKHTHKLYLTNIQTHKHVPLLPLDTMTAPRQALPTKKEKVGI